MGLLTARMLACCYLFLSFDISLGECACSLPSVSSATFYNWSLGWHVCKAQYSSSCSKMADGGSVAACTPFFESHILNPSRYCEFSRVHDFNRVEGLVRIYSRGRRKTEEG